MKTTTNKVRNTKTGQVFDVIPGSLLPDFFEEVRDDNIKVGEPKVEFEVEQEALKEEKAPEVKEEPKEEKPKTTPKRKSTKKTTKKGKKNGTSKRN